MLNSYSIPREGDLLAAGCNDQFFLPIYDSQIAVFVQGADVSGVEPFLGIDGLRGFFGPVVVSFHDVPAPDQYSAVFGNLHVDAWYHGTDGSYLILSRKIDIGKGACFRESISLA